MLKNKIFIQILPFDMRGYFETSVFEVKGVKCICFFFITNRRVCSVQPRF